MVARICLVSGGTGGHLVPALTLARAIRERGHEPFLVTEGRSVESELLVREAEDFEVMGLPGGRPSRLRLPSWLVQTTWRARRLLREQSAGCVVSTGGRSSVPMGLAARSLGKPLFLLEQNAVTGRANRLLRRFAARTYLGLPGQDADRADAMLTGTPLRPDFYRLDQATVRAELGLDPARPVVLVTGGSQGARSLNETVPAALGMLAGNACESGDGSAYGNKPARRHLHRPRRDVQVLHLSGVGNEAAVRERYLAHEMVGPVVVQPMAANMAQLLVAADLVICRGGGTTVAELMAAGKPAIIVPYPHHRDQQQRCNAEVLVRAGGAVVVEEGRLDAEHLYETLAALMLVPDRLPAMGAAAGRLAASDAAGAILDDMERQGGLR